MDDERQRGSALQYLVEKRIRIVIEWLQLNVRFITYLDLQSFEVVAFRNSICQVFVSEATPLSDVSRAPKSRDMSGNVPPDFAYLSEAKGSAHRTSVVQDFVRHARLEDERYDFSWQEANGCEE